MKKIIKISALALLSCLWVGKNAADCPEHYSMEVNAPSMQEAGELAQEKQETSELEAGQEEPIIESEEIMLEEETMPSTQQEETQAGSETEAAVQQ